MKPLRLLIFSLALVLVYSEPRREYSEPQRESKIEPYSSCQLCAECIASGHQENFQCQRICDACDPRSGWPTPSPTPGPITTTCGVCTEYPRSSPECLCCGSNLCSDYYLGISTPEDPYYAQLRDIARFQSSCEYGPNFGCPTCALWRKINNYATTEREICNGTSYQCWVVRELRHTFLAANNVTDRRHYLLLPGSVDFRWPVIGIEDMQVLHMEETWAVVYNVALRPYENLPVGYNTISTLPVSSMTSDIGLALNPACTRSQHQMHIHVEPVPVAFREILRGGRDGAFRVWTRITLNTLIGGVTLLVKYFPLRNPAAARPFETVFNLAGDFTNLRAWGIIIIPDEERIPAERGRPFPPGFYFVTGAYNSEVPPSFNRYPVNENFEPENLLCNCYSSGESGVFWSSNNCPTLQCPSSPRFLFRLGPQGRGNPQPWTDSLFPIAADNTSSPSLDDLDDSFSTTVKASVMGSPENVTTEGGHT